MNPREFDFFFQLIEASMERAYLRGRADENEGKCQPEQGFRLSPESRLNIKTKLNKHLKKR